MDVTTATLPLNTGRRIPQIGLGVWQAARGKQTQQAVLTALRLGYRHIDTAHLYGNEEDVGRAVRASELPREEIFVTTKLWNDDHGYDAAQRAFDRSLARLGLDYVDLYLIHWPVPGRRRDSWRALEKIFADGRARAIGVSNYMRPHLSELLDHAKTVPAADQIEITPYLQHRETRAYCKKHGIVVEAYSPLTRGEKLEDPRLVEIAREVERTAAQVLLRWSVQSGLVPLPKSVRPARIEENSKLFDFELDKSAMSRLDALEEGLALDWDPRNQD